MNIRNIIRAIILYTYSLINSNRRSKVIYYHDVYNNNKYTDTGTPFELFKQHIEVIKNNKFDLVSQINSKKNQIMICFDDGFRGIWDCRDFFIENGIKPTIFVAVELIGTEGYLTVEEIKELKQHGFMFESHTWSHTNLTKLTGDELKREIKYSKDKLEELLCCDINDICFPQGFYSNYIVELSQKAGYRYLYVSDPAPYYNGVNNGIIHRYLVQDCKPSILKAIIFGGMDIMYAHYRNYHFK